VPDTGTVATFLAIVYLINIYISNLYHLRHQHNVVNKKNIKISHKLELCSGSFLDKAKSSGSKHIQFHIKTCSMAARKVCHKYFGSTMPFLFSSSVSEPKRLFPDPDPTFQILPDLDPAPHPDLDPFPVRVKIKSFKEHTKKMYTSFRSV